MSIKTNLKRLKSRPEAKKTLKADPAGASAV
jgi:hypothetical protein